MPIDKTLLQDIDDDGHCRTCDRPAGGCHCSIYPTDINPDEEEARAAAQSIYEDRLKGLNSVGCRCDDALNESCDNCHPCGGQKKDTTFTPEEDH